MQPHKIDLTKWDALARAEVDKTNDELIDELVTEFNKLVEYLQKRGI